MTDKKQETRETDLDKEVESDIKETSNKDTLQN